PNNTCPPEDRTEPATAFISVVLPAPLGPMSACLSPALTLRSTPSRARNPLYCTDRPNVRSSACVSSLCARLLISRRTLLTLYRDFVCRARRSGAYAGAASLGTSRECHFWQ